MELFIDGMGGAAPRPSRGLKGFLGALTIQELLVDGPVEGHAHLVQHGPAHGGADGLLEGRTGSGVRGADPHTNLGLELLAAHGEPAHEKLLVIPAQGFAYSSQQQRDPHSVNDGLDESERERERERRGNGETLRQPETAC